MLDLNPDRLRELVEMMRDGKPLLYEGCADLCDMLDDLAHLTPETLHLVLAACVKAAGLPEVGAKVRYEGNRKVVDSYLLWRGGDGPMHVDCYINSEGHYAEDAESIPLSDAAALEVVPGE